jgi:hypothetical protein
MFDNALQDVQFVGDYYGEYLKQIDRYKNLKRPSVFCRYLKINKDASTFHTESKGTHDRYYSGIMYDSYEYTPVHMVNQIVNNSQDIQEKKGRMFEGETEVITYTIDKPNHNDLIVFPYTPNNPNGEIFRVKEVSVSLNSLNENIKYSRLNLEKAPVDQNKLKHLNSYVYLMTQEEYVPTQKYLRIIEEYKKFQEIFSILEKSYWNKKHELYYYNYNGQRIAPLKQNQMIYDFLTQRRHNTRYFTHTKIPFGVKEYSDPLGDGEGFDLDTEKRTDMDGTNNPVILGWENFLNTVLFQDLPWGTSFYYFVEGRPEYGDKLPSEYTENIIKYEIKEDTLLMDFAALIKDFKG